jgi:hypothetical protein
MRFESLFDLEEDLDHLLKVGDEGATACQGPPIFDNYSNSDNNPESFLGSHLGLTITTMPQGRFMYWKGMEPCELLEYDSHLVAFTQELPFQEGKPLSCITEEEEGNTELVEYTHTAKTSPDRQVYMVFLRNQEAIEYIVTSRVLEPSAEVFMAAQKLTDIEMEVSNQRSSQSRVKPNPSDIGIKTIQLRECVKVHLGLMTYFGD